MERKEDWILFEEPPTAVRLKLEADSHGILVLRDPDLGCRCRSSQFTQLQSSTPIGVVFPSSRVTTSHNSKIELHGWLLASLPLIFTVGSSLDVAGFTFTLQSPSPFSNLLPRVPSSSLPPSMNTSVNYTPNDANLMDDEPDIAFDMEAENDDFVDDDLQILKDSTNPSSTKGKATDDSGLEKEKPSKNPRKCTYEVWKSLTKIAVVDRKERAKCNRCERKYIVGSGKIGTSTLAHHIPKCPGLSQYHNVGIMMLDQEGKLRSRQIDHKRAREEIDKSSMIRYLWLNHIKLPQLSYPSIDLRPEDKAQADEDDTHH
ncbi:putative AC transposase [Senna tora]|uniref:Putative AC transposase n=1 Tax=Senna tora TaxID=362788 RepID=A0A834SG29_9FABA|nr:putative AC transposase [Senna tora]